jgi:hypothetical protein
MWRLECVEYFPEGGRNMEELKNISIRNLKIIYLVGYVVRWKYDVVLNTYSKWIWNSETTSQLFSNSMEKNTSEADNVPVGWAVARFCEY